MADSRRPRTHRRPSNYRNSTEHHPSSEQSVSQTSSQPSTTAAATASSKLSHHLPSLHSHRDKRHEVAGPSTSRHAKISAELNHHRHNARDTLSSAVAAHAPSSLHELVRGSGSGSDRSHQGSNGRGQAPSHSHRRRESRHHHHHHRHSGHAHKNDRHKNGGRSGGGGSSGTGSAPLSRRPSFQVEIRPLKPPKVEALKAADDRRVADLKEAFGETTALALETTRGLDDVHYALLEKFSVLGSTLSSLREVVRGEQMLASSFDEDVEDMENEVTAQIESLESFAERESEKIEDLANRLERARSRAADLSKRLEGAGKKVEERERVELQWEARVARRLRVLWGVLVTMLAVLLVGGLVAWLRPVELSSESPSKALNWSLPEPVGDIIGNLRESEPAEMQPKEEDPRLRLLDEL